MKFYSAHFAVGLVLVIAAALSTTALAQTPPLATSGCTKPAMPDATKKLVAAETNAFVRSLETFRNCVQAFSESQKLIAATKQKEAEAFKVSALDASQAATAAAAAADAAAKDYNAFSEQAIKIVTPKEPADAPKKVIEPPAPRPQRGY